MLSNLNDLKATYSKNKSKIINRLSEFENLWDKGKENDIFAELVFCLLTPQSKAKKCWATVEILKKKRLLIQGSQKIIAEQLRNVRFRNNKTKYILLARKSFINKNKVALRSKIENLENVFNKREWLVKNIKGFGFKEASHFLRNTGFGKEIAILDRHILKNLNKLGTIKSIPVSLTKKKYLEIEKKMTKLAKDIKIPLDHLDLVMWCRETGDVFK